jgi:hypothetical protein
VASGSRNLISSEIRSENIGDDDRTVRLLVVFEDCDEGPTNGETGAVQGVRETRFAAAGRPVANAGTASLKIAAVRTRRNLAVAALPRQPNFQIERLRGREPKIARRERDDAIGKVQALQNRFGVAKGARRSPEMARRGQSDSVRRQEGGDHAPPARLSAPELRGSCSRHPRPTWDARRAGGGAPRFPRSRSLRACRK